MTNSKNYDFTSCMIDFTTCPVNERIVRHFPELAVYPEFSNVQDDNLIRIAICLSDLESPFVRMDHKLRLTQMFEMFNIGLKNVKNQDFFDRLLEYKDDSVIDLCMRYLQVFNNHDYTRWWTMNTSYYEFQRGALRPREAGESDDKYFSRKMNMQDKLDTMAGKLMEYEAALFKDSKLKRAIHQQQLKEKIHTFPEEMAQKFNGFTEE